MTTSAHSHGLTVDILRFVKIVGPDLKWDIIPVFIEELLADLDRLKNLGNRQQEQLPFPSMSASRR